ncbi:uncharacterized protein [Rutidosis leptorrhynchoides]|uniref:uncharacterized protein n=1 Tax=Rutidosis leptorrhynchoides TaxID=125765 RepID=UPI003A99867E
MELEETFDVDDSDLILRPCKHHRTTTTTAPNTTAAVELSQSQTLARSQSKSQTLARSQSNSQTLALSQSKSQTLDTSLLQSETVESPLLYTIPGPAGLIQAAKLRKKLDNQVEHSMDTQDYIRKGGEDPEEDDDFQLSPWLSAIEFAYPDGGKSTLGEIKDYKKNGKLDKVVAVIKSCAPNALGDLTVVLKDTTGTISGTIHHKVLAEAEFAKALCVGSVLILHKVSVFSPSRSTHILNITKKNLVKVFKKDGGSAQIQTSQGSVQDSGRGTQAMHSEFSMELRSEGINLSTNCMNVEQETYAISSFGNQIRKTSNQGKNQVSVKDKEILKEAGRCENEHRAIENVTQMTEGNKNGPKGTDVVQIHLEPAKVVASLPVYTDEQLDILADIENDMF